MKLLLVLLSIYYCNASELNLPKLPNNKKVDSEKVYFELINSDQTLDPNTFIVNSYSIICSNRIATITNCNNIGQIYKPVLFVYDNGSTNKTMFNKLYVQDTANTRDVTFNYLFMLLDLTNFVNTLTSSWVYKSITIVSIADVNNIEFYLKIIYKLY
jgi:hypothetical protein